MSAMVASMTAQGNRDGGNSNLGSQIDDTANLDWSINLDSSKGYKLNWSYDYPGNSITFALEINQTKNSTSSQFRTGLDIFAIGFSKNTKPTSPSLANADFCLLWFDLSHRAHLQDAQTDSKSILKLIEEQRSVCKLQSTKETLSIAKNKLDQVRKHAHKRRHKNNNNNQKEDDGQTSFIFSRPIDVCNNQKGNYYTIDNGTTHLVWFTLKGPQLTIDGLDLRQQDEKQLDWAFNRIQLIASRRPFEVVVKATRQQNDIKTTQKGYYKDYDYIRDDDLEEADEEVEEFEHVRKEVVKDFEIKMDNFKVPARETTYWCKLFRLPRKFRAIRKHHIIKYGPKIQPGNEHVVHHMEVFNCPNLSPEQEEQMSRLYELGGWSGECGDLSKRPKVTLSCRKVIMAWAMGAKPLEYPDQVGQSIGGPGYAPYVVLEVHYNNPKSEPGLIDSSGLGFRYTNKLRPYEAGILEVGLEYTDKYAIPPNLITPLAGYCVSECTRVGLSSSSSSSSSSLSQSNFQDEENEPASLMKSQRKLSSFSRKYESDNVYLDNNFRNHEHGQLKEGIYIFAAQLHTHLVGVASWTEHIREGKFLSEIQRDDHYSPHFQEIRYLAKPVHVAPGDGLIHYCLYDTSSRVNVTLGGEATTDEMCVTYIHYYPRKDLEVCKSSVDSEALESYFDFLRREENQRTSSRLKELQVSSKNLSNLSGELRIDAAEELKTVSENYRSIEWTQRRSKELIQFYANAPLSVQCNRSNGDRFPGAWNGIEPIRVWAQQQKLKSNSREEQDNLEMELELKPRKKPFELTFPSGRQLLAYRGRNYGRRHAQCEL